jgi:hypothetical protein
MAWIKYVCEHSIANTFVIPAGTMLGASVSVSKWLFWNQLRVSHTERRPRWICRNGNKLIKTLISVAD